MVFDAVCPVSENGTIEEDEFVALLVQNMQSREEVERDLQEAFEAFDRNGDGRIDKTGEALPIECCGIFT